MKRIKTALVVATLTTTLAFINTPAASAVDRGPLDPNSYKVSDVIVGKNSQLCANRSMFMKGNLLKTKTPSYSDVEIAVMVYGPRGEYVGQEPIWFDNPRVNKKMKSFGAKTTFMTCAHGHGYGRYTVGDAKLRYSIHGRKSFDARDISRSYYYVRGAAKTGLKATRKGKYVTLSMSASRYSLRQGQDEVGYPHASGRFKPYNAKAVKFQVKSGSTWKTLKTLDLKNGKASIKVKQTAKRQYRIMLNKTPTTTGTTSKVVKK